MFNCKICGEPLANPLVGISTALAVSTVVAITQILTLSHLDWWLTIAVWCFAIALPLLIAVSINPIRPLLIPQGVKVVMPPIAVRDFHVFLLVCAVDIVGFALIFFHFGLIAGCLFCVFSWIGLHESNFLSHRFARKAWKVRANSRSDNGAAYSPTARQISGKSARN